MRHVSSISVGKLLWAALLACFLQASLVVLADDLSLSKSDDNLQLDDELSKREWKGQLRMWGKRGGGTNWNNLNYGWGKKRTASPLWGDQVNYYSQPIDKRAWQNLQGGWGKRFADDDYNLQHYLEQQNEEEQNEPRYIQYEPYSRDYDVEKRAWKPDALRGAWGKRGNDWNRVRGVWGKRDPAWSNLKGIWGKRSVDQQLANK